VLTADPQPRPAHPALAGVHFNVPTQLVYGENALARLPDLVRAAGGTRPLIVTDEGLVKAGHVSRAVALLEQAGLAAGVFSRVTANPTDETVNACEDAARGHKTDVLIGLGGGSSLDTAKGANFVLTNGGPMSKLKGVNRAEKPLLPLIAIPTTAGTGSECQAFALIADARTHLKMACGDEKAYPRAALLDPLLTLSLPADQTANTGIDAITHAVEAHVTQTRTVLSQMYSREAWRLLNASFETVLREPRNVPARGQMLLGSAFAGLAIANAMLGCAHSTANPLTAHRNVIHGQAVGLMLPHVMRYNSADAEAAANYADLAVVAGLASPQTPVSDAAAALVQRIEVLLDVAKVPASLRLFEKPVGEELIPTLAAEAAQQWTARFNPRAVDAAALAGLYQAALTPRGGRA
jgi:alcohol dehydrogenase